MAIFLGSPVLLFTACSSDDYNGGCLKSSLISTKWTTSYVDYTMVIEFMLESKVQSYFAEPNGVYDSGRTNRTHKVSGNNITFSNLTFKWIYAYYRLLTGTISGSLLSTSRKESFNIDNGHLSLHFQFGTSSLIL